ncbi:translation protein [Lipomyces orientalis]|uniref:Translation protein n=1 Tax=Lipomyces orientalis TaxID=1233043 RepID=A0ACC3TXZ3_9ASCO
MVVSRVVATQRRALLSSAALRRTVMGCSEFRSSHTTSTSARPDIPTLSEFVSSFTTRQIEEPVVTNTTEVHTSITTTIPIAAAAPGHRRFKRSELPLPVLFDSPHAALSRKQLPKRTGTIAFKRGMMSIFDENGVRIPVTILQIDRVEVTYVKTLDKHGYFAVQVGAGARQAKNVTKPMLGHFSKAGVAPKKTVAEFRVRDESGLLPITQEITAEHFKEGQFVDIWARSKGKGFSGVMKRHGFSGLPASHGVSVSHRSAGSTGQSQDPGRVLKGKKMAGRMGGDYVTVQNSKVVKIYPEYGLVLVKGPVPGPKYAAVSIQDALKKPDVE